MSRKDKALVRRIYFTEFFGEAFAVYALIPLFFEQYGSVTVVQVGLLLAVWQIATVIFELPTGLVADTYGRRVSMQWGKFSNLIGLVVWLLFPSFSGLLAGVLVMAFGNALLSGSLEAYTYDELNNKKAYNKIRQQTVAVHLAAFSFAGFVAYLLNVNYELLVIASIVSASIGFLSSFLLPADSSRHHDRISVTELVNDTKQEVSQHTAVLRLFLSAATATALLVFFIEQITLFYADTGVSNRTVALLMAIGNIVTFVLLWTLHVYEAWSRRYAQVLLAGLFLLLGVVFALGNVWLQIAFMFLSVRVVRIVYLHAGNDLQHAINSKSRATVGSFASFCGKLLASVGILAVGLLSASSSDSRLPIYIIGVLLIGLYILLERKRTKLS